MPEIEKQAPSTAPVTGRERFRHYVVREDGDAIIASLLDQPASRVLPHFQLERIVRVLLQASNRTERYIVGAVDYQGLTFSEAAELLNLPSGRVAELYQSTHQRELGTSQRNAGKARRTAVINAKPASTSRKGKQ